MDPSLPVLTLEEGSRLRALVQRALAAHGHEGQALPDAVVTASGARVELAALSLACRYDERGPGAWSARVESSVAQAVHPDGAPSPLATLDAEQVRAAVHPQILHVHDVPAGVVVVDEVACDLVQVLAVDLVPGSGGSALLHAADVERCGPLDELEALAREHLHDLTPTWSILDRDGSRVDILASPSPYAASLILLLPDIVGAHLRDAPTFDRSRGVLFAVPFGHQLDLHVLSDDSARISLAALALFAATGFNDGEGQISPDVHWWHDGRVDRVSHLTPDGVVLDLGPELAAVLDKLAPPGTGPAAPLEV